MKMFNKIKKLIQKNQANLSDNQFFTNKTDIIIWLDKHKINNYTINDDLSVDVNGDVNIFIKSLKRIPIKFRNIAGDFWCSRNNKLTSLLEIIYCNFKGNIFFNIDEKNFNQKELTQVLKKYYNSKYELYELTNHQFHDIIKPVLEKEILKQKLTKKSNDTNIKKIYI